MNLIRARRTIYLATILAAVTPAICEAQARLANATQEARRAIAARDSAAAIKATDSLIAWYPHYPNTVLLRARAEMVGGRPSDAERSLRRLLAWDPRYVRYALTDSILKPLGSRLTDVDVNALAARADSPVSHGRVWATIEERDLIAEGTAWDGTTKSVLIGSLNKNKIVAITPDGKVSDRVAASSNGLGSVVGIHVDSARGILWVASNRRYDTPADSSRSALFAFDVTSGRFRSKVMSPSKSLNFFNDITTDPAGNVYLTDTQGGAVWVLRSGADELVPLDAAGAVTSPNGITISRDGRHLFIADLDHIKVVDLTGGTSWRLEVPDAVSVAGIDGLAFADGALIAHHPLAFWRIARYDLDPSMRRVTAKTVIEQSTPDSRTSTTGEMVGTDYVYIGNSQIDRMNAGTINFTTMEPIRIYRAAIRR
jgi:sugar lactone lactonase YvrE